MPVFGLDTSASSCPAIPPPPQFTYATTHPLPPSFPSCPPFYLHPQLTHPPPPMDSAFHSDLPPNPSDHSNWASQPYPNWAPHPFFEAPSYCPYPGGQDYPDVLAWLDPSSEEYLYANARTDSLPSWADPPPINTELSLLPNSNSNSSTRLFSHGRRTSSPPPAPSRPLNQMSLPYSTVGARKHGFPDTYVISSPSQSKKFAEEGGSRRSWQTDANSYTDVGRVALPSWSINPMHKTQTTLVDDLEKMDKNMLKEANTARSTDKMREEGQSSGFSHINIGNLSKQDAVNLMDDDQLQIDKEKLIQRSCVLTGEQGLQGKGGILSGTDTDVTSVLSHNIEFSKDFTLCFQEKAHRCMDSIYTGIVEGPSEISHGLLFKSKHPFTNEHLIASQNKTGVIEQESGSTGCISKHSDAQASGSSPASDLQEKNHCGSLVFNVMTPPGIEAKGKFNEEVNVNDAQNGQNIDSKLDISHADKIFSNTSLLSKVLPSSNSCHLLISSIYNLSRVLVTSQSKNCTNDFENLDLGALENSIFMLSQSLLKRSSTDNLSEASCEPTMKTQQNQEHFQGQKTLSHNSNEGDDHPGSKAREHLQGQKKLSQNLNEGDDHSGLKAQGICLERDGKVIAMRKEAESTSIKKHLEKPLKEILDLQGELLQLHESIAYERNESNAMVSIYKTLWREAQEGLSYSTSEMMKIKAGLHSLEQTLRKLQNHPGVCDISGKVLEPNHNCEEHQPLHTNSDSEDKSDFLVSRGKGLPKNQEVLTEYFGPVKSVEVDLKGSSSFPDIKEVISRFSILQARGDSNVVGAKDETTSNSLSKPSQDFPANIDEGVVQRLGVLVARDSITSSNDYVNASDLENCSGLGHNLQMLIGAMSTDVPQVPVCLQAETPVELKGFGKVYSECNLASNPVSEKAGKDVMNHGSWDGQVKVGGACDGVLVESNQTNNNCPNTRELKDEAEFVQDGEPELSLNPSLQSETETICVRPSDAETSSSSCAGDAEWELLLPGL